MTINRVGQLANFTDHCMFTFHDEYKLAVDLLFQSANLCHIKQSYFWRHDTTLINEC